MPAPSTESLAQASERLFTQARTPSAWLPEPVPERVLREIHELARWGPTSMNCQPLRIVFARGADARARLAACVNPGNVAKVRSAPVVAVLGQDMDFVDRLSTLFAHKTDARSYYEGKPAVVASTALRNSSLQAAYLMLAARLHGLDCGPMSGFDAAAVDAAFWAGTSVRTNFLCALGHGDTATVKPRLHRLGFDDICQVVDV
jgi:3-hydroxypropanoate dehydrogenase